MNSYGRLFRVSIFGESHGVCAGVLIDGTPPGIKVDTKDFQSELAKRRPNITGVTKRAEKDFPNVMSGIFDGHTTGAPIMIYLQNEDVRSNDYSDIKVKPRPGHADFTAFKKFKGFNDYRGSGHFSGRLTAGIVAAGVLANKIIDPIKISANIVEINGKNRWDKDLEDALREGDSLGGVVECRLHNVPVGLGEPFFDSFESMIAHMMFSIPAIKGVEFGAGFESSRMRGSELNDIILNKNGKTKTNFAGGINGGISNGNEIVFRVAVKPASSISKKQKTIDIKTGKSVDLQIKGRHDACIALRVAPVIQSAAAIVTADLLLIQKAYEGK